MTRINLSMSVTEEKESVGDVLKKLKSVRTAYRGHCTRNIKDASTMMMSDNPDVDDMSNLVDAVTERLRKINQIDEEIERFSGPDTVGKEIEEYLTYNDKLNKDMGKIKKFLLTKMEARNPYTNGTYMGGFMSSPVRKSVSVKLPKITLNNFSGDPLEWNSFWDSFRSAIHDNPSLSNVDKMNYLVGFLKGDAAKSVSGFTLTNDNYDIVTKLLEERFGRKQVLVNAYMDEFLNLPVAKNDVKSLRRFFDAMESNIRGLESLKYSPDSYGSLLLPIVLKKLPEDVKRILLRDEENLDIGKLRTGLQKEVEIRELSLLEGSDKPNKKGDRVVNEDENVSSMFIGNHNGRQRTAQSNGFDMTKNCVFCGKSHLAENCKTVVDVDKRLDILKKQGRCFSCMKRNHMANKCRSRPKCSICSKIHYEALCRGEEEK